VDKLKSICADPQHHQQNLNCANKQEHKTATSAGEDVLELELPCLLVGCRTGQPSWKMT
jgi:hypothetical protein